MVAAAVLGAGAVSAGASVFGASQQAGAAEDAAQLQQQTAEQQAAQQMQMFQQVQGNLAPFMATGQRATQSLEGMLPSLTAPFQPTMAQLEQTPGYQFTLDQGLQAVQNSATAQGLGVSGAALKAGANYASGLASQTYQQQFQNYLAQNQQTYNQYAGLANMGENAAAGVGQMGMQSQAQVNNLMTSGAAAGAAGMIGSANAWAGAANNIGGTASNMGMMTALMGNGMFGGSGTTGTLGSLMAYNPANGVGM